MKLRPPTPFEHTVAVTLRSLALAIAGIVAALAFTAELVTLARGPIWHRGASGVELPGHAYFVAFCVAIYALIVAALWLAPKAIRLLRWVEWASAAPEKPKSDPGRFREGLE